MTEFEPPIEDSVNKRIQKNRKLLSDALAIVAVLQRNGFEVGQVLLNDFEPIFL